MVFNGIPGNFSSSELVFAIKTLRFNFSIKPGILLKTIPLNPKISVLSFNGKQQKAF